jgi:hypothetical protein
MKKLTLSDTQRNNILNYLENIPSAWQLTPVSGKKGYLKGWQNGIDRQTIQEELNNKATGIGIILGELSGGIVAIDEDGEEASAIAAELSRGINPPTYTFTSGRENRRQRLYRIPEQYWEFIQTRRLSCGLEFRWNGCQSVLPYSLHPLTKSTYQEINNAEIAIAPQWVISAMMNPEVKREFNTDSPKETRHTDTFWHSNFVLFPPRIYNYYGPCLKIWLLTRWFDQAGKNHHKFTIYAASQLLRRKPSTIHKWLREAKAKGLIRHYYATSDGYIKVFYAALWKVALEAGLDDLGPVARINLCDLNNLTIASTQIEKQFVQKQSAYNASRAEHDRLVELGKPPEIASKLSRYIEPEKLLTHPCENLERVLCVSNKTLFVSEGFISYGASAENIAKIRGIHPGTVSRHLSNIYRSPSPKKGWKSECYALPKKQVLKRCHRDFKNFNGDRRYWQGKGINNREWERRPSIIAEQYSLARAKSARKAVSHLAGIFREVTSIVSQFFTDIGLLLTIFKAFSPLV